MQSKRPLGASRIAWWFASEPKLPNGDDRPVSIGETHKISGKLAICRNALHWSREPFDALQYARGPLLYKVRPIGQIIEENDKGCSRGRTYLDMRNVTEMLRAFALSEALNATHLWDCPPAVRQYLETGDETIRVAAGDETIRVAARYVTQHVSASRGGAAAAVRAAVAATHPNAWHGALHALWDYDAPGHTSGHRQRFNTKVYELF